MIILMSNVSGLAIFTPFGRQSSYCEPWPLFAN